MDRAALGAAWAKLKTGTLWSSTGRCKGYAPSNPNEAATLDSYVSAIVGGADPPTPIVATDTGQGLAAIIAAGLVASPPKFKVSIAGTAKSGSTLSAVVT